MRVHHAGILKEKKTCHEKIHQEVGSVERVSTTHSPHLLSRRHSFFDQLINSRVHLSLVTEERRRTLFNRHLKKVLALQSIPHSQTFFRSDLAVLRVLPLLFTS